MFYITDYVIGICFLVDIGAEDSIIPISSIPGSRKETSIQLQAVNHLPILICGKQFLTLDLGLHCTFL